MPTNRHPEDPAEGSRETVERELERSDRKRPADMQQDERRKGSKRQGEESGAEAERRDPGRSG